MSLLVKVAGCFQRLVVLQIALIYGVIIAQIALLRFLCNPFSFFRMKRRTAPPSCMQDPRYGKHKKVTLNGHGLHFVENGYPQKPLVVLIHGFPENWYSWRHQLIALASDYHVVALSLPGYCDSDALRSADDCRLDRLAADVHALIKHLGYEQAAVVGHDWGAAVSWEVAYLYPNVVRRLVVLDCPVRPAYQERLTSSLQFFRSWFVFFHQLPWLPDLLWRANDMQLLDFMMTSRWFGVANRRLLSEEDMECFKYYFCKHGFRDPLAYYSTTLSYKVLVEATEAAIRGEKVHIKPKTLILWGGADNFLLPVMAYDSAKFCDDARVQIFEGASHWLQQHEPEGVSTAIKQFLFES